MYIYMKMRLKVMKNKGAVNVWKNMKYLFKILSRSNHMQRKCFKYLFKQKREANEYE